MAIEKFEMMESEFPTECPPLAAEPVKELSEDVAEEKSVIPLNRPGENADEFKSLALVEDPQEKTEEKEEGNEISINNREPQEKTEEKEKSNEGSFKGDTDLAQVAKEKQLSLIKAWEESERSKADNKAQKKLSDIWAWENCQKAALEAKLKEQEKNLEEKRAKYVEKWKNRMAEIHRSVEEKKALVEAEHGGYMVKVEEKAAKYRATGTFPKKLFPCFESFSLCGLNKVWL